MQHSETITKISLDFLEAQKEIESAKKDAKNPFFHSNYADLNSVMSACKDSLNKHNISVLQPVMGDVVETMLLHTSGEWFKSETKIINAKPNDPQAQGSAITYARRYGLQSMIFIGAEDDDGERAVNRTSEPVQTAKTVSKPVSGLVGHCELHNAEMREAISKKTGKPYFSHRLDNGGLCFGEKKPKLPVDETPIQRNDYEDALSSQVADEIPF